MPLIDQIEVFLVTLPGWSGMSFLPLKLGRQGAGRSQHVQASKGGPGCKESGLLACWPVS